MSGRPLNPLLEKGRIRAFCEHIRVIVALNKYCIKSQEHLLESIKDMPEVGHDTEPFVPGCDDKYCPISAVMRRGDCLHRYFFKDYLTVGLEMSYILKLAECVTHDCRLEGLFCNVQGDPVFSLVNACISDMVSMVMGNDHCIDIPDIASQCRKLFFCLDTVYSCIEEELQPACLDIDTVSAAA